MASVIFILPSLVIIGWWTVFPFWTSFLICAAGGVLGVLFTIPLRRALVTQSDLPYPEGVAAAEVLKVGADAREANPEAREGLLAVIYGALASAGLAIAVAMRLAVDGAEGFFRTGAVAASGYSFSFSLALVGAGHLVGLSVGLAMLVGILIAWAGAVPIITAMTPMHGDLASFVGGIWRNDVRFIGAGAMAVAAVWSLLRTVGPIIGGIKATMQTRGGVADYADQTDRDCLSRSFLRLALASTALCAWLVWRFSGNTGHGRFGLRDLAVLYPAYSCRRFFRLGHLRLYGGPDRLIQQSYFGRGHPGGGGLGAGAWWFCSAAMTPDLWWRSRCSSLQSCLQSPAAPTTICRTSRPVNWWARRHGASNSVAGRHGSGDDYRAHRPQSSGQGLWLFRRAQSSQHHSPAFGGAEANLMAALAQG